MSEEIKNVKLSFSCNENWDAMPLADGGRHCDKCQKKVYDFTNSKEDEFRKILEENREGICGHFSTEQMVQKNLSLTFWKRWMPAAVVYIGISLFACKSPETKVYVTTGVPLLPLPDSTLKGSKLADTTKCTTSTTTLKKTKK